MKLLEVRHRLFIGSGRPVTAVGVDVHPERRSPRYYETSD